MLRHKETPGPLNLRCPRAPIIHVRETAPTSHMPAPAVGADPLRQPRQREAAQIISWPHRSICQIAAHLSTTDASSTGEFMVKTKRNQARSEGYEMVEAAAYSHHEVLRDGRRMEIRALRPGDRDGLLAAVGRVAPPSLYRRFLGAKHGFSEREVAFFSNVDFINHVALVAVMPEDGRETIVGGARYIVARPGEAEVAFTVVDDYQG